MSSNRHATDAAVTLAVEAVADTAEFFDTTPVQHSDAWQRFNALAAETDDVDRLTHEQWLDVLEAAHEQGKVESGIFGIELADD